MNIKKEYIKKELLSLEELLKHEKFYDVAKKLSKVDKNHINEILKRDGSFRFAYAYPKFSVSGISIPNVIEIHFNSIEEVYSVFNAFYKSY